MRSAEWDSVPGAPSTVISSKETKSDGRDSKDDQNNEKVFWGVARPMAILAVIGGLSPYPWPRKKNDVYWKWQRRWPTIIHFLLLATYITILICKPPSYWIKVITKNPTDKATYITMQTVILATPWINYIWIQVKVSQIWSLFYRFSQLHGSIDKKLKKNSVMLVAGCFLLPLVERVVVVGQLVASDSWYTWFYLLLFVHALFLFNLIPIQVTFLAIIVRSQLQCFNAHIMEVCTALCSSTMVQHDLRVKQKLTSSTELFFELSLLVENMDSIYGTSIMITYLIYVVASTSYLFYLIVLYSGNPSFFLMISTVIAALILSMVAFTGILGSIPRQSTKSLTRLIQVNRLVSNPHIKSEIEALIQKMTGPPIEITAASYFAINRGLLTSVLGAVTTYLIVLAQFKVSENAEGTTSKTTIATTTSANV